MRKLSTLQIDIDSSHSCANEGWLTMILRMRQSLARVTWPNLFLKSVGGWFIWYLWFAQWWPMVWAWWNELVAFDYMYATCYYVWVVSMVLKLTNVTWFNLLFRLVSFEYVGVVSSFDDIPPTLYVLLDMCLYGR